MGDDAYPSSEPLMAIIWGSWAADVLACGVDIGLFALLDEDSGQTTAQLVEHMRLEPAPAEQFFAAASALGLIEAHEGRWHNSRLAERFLVPGRPGYMGAFACFMRDRQNSKKGVLADLLRNQWKPSFGDGGDGGDLSALRGFWAGLHAMSVHAGTVLAESIPLNQHQSILDVGGGTGAYAIGLCQRLPTLSVTVYELDFVADWAGEEVRKAGFAHQIEVVAGDFINAELPSGHDVIMLNSVLHDWDAGTVRDLLAKCHRALPPGGRIVVNESMLNESGSGPLAAALLGVSTMMATPGGRSYREADHRAALTAAGFTEITSHEIPLAHADRALTAVRP